MPIGRALDKRAWEELIEKVKALPVIHHPVLRINTGSGTSQLGEDKYVKLDEVLHLLEEQKGNV
jgi:hypothetical protein